MRVRDHVMGRAVPAARATFRGPARGTRRPRRSRAASLVAAAAVAALLVACGGGTPERGRGTTASEPPPSTPRTPPSPSDDPSTEGDLLLAEFGIARIEALDVEAGPLPFRLLGDDFWDYVDDEGRIDPAVERLFGDRRVELAPGEVVVELAETRESLVGECRLIHRWVRGVEVGIAGDAGDRIAAQLRRSSDPDTLFDFPGSSIVYSDPAEIVGRFCAEAAAAGVTEFYQVDEVAPVPCGLPKRELRCYSVSRLGAAVGGAVNLMGFVLVFDRETGELVPLADRHPGLTEPEAERLIQLVARELPFERGTFGSGTDPGRSPVSNGSLVPTVDGLAYVEMVWGLDTPIAIQVGQLVLPWDLVRRAAEHRAALPPEVRADPGWGDDADA